MIVNIVKATLALAALRKISKAIKSLEILKEEEEEKDIIQPVHEQQDQRETSRGVEGKRRESASRLDRVPPAPARALKVQALTRTKARADRRRSVKKSSDDIEVQSVNNEVESTSEDGALGIREQRHLEQNHRREQQHQHQQEGRQVYSEEQPLHVAAKKKLSRSRRSSLERQRDSRNGREREWEGEEPRVGLDVDFGDYEVEENHVIYSRENSPEVVKIKVDLIESLKDNLENIKENIQDNLELLPGESDPRHDHGDGNHAYTVPASAHAAHARRSSAPSSLYGRPSEMLRVDEQGFHTMPAGKGMRYSSEGNTYNEAQTGTYDAPHSATDSPLRAGEELTEGEDDNEGAEEEESPTYIVHEKQIMPVAGFRKKKQKMLIVSNDSPEWFQSKYKSNASESASTNTNNTIAAGSASGSGSKSQSPSRNETIPKGGGKQKVECRYVTQVSDCSPDWFRTKYSKSYGLYHPMPSTGPAPSSSSSSAPNATIRKLSFPEDQEAR